MKRSLKLSLTAWLCLAFFACKSPERYLEQHRYDAAVHAASNRLDGKNQRSRHVRSLETAIDKANQHDVQTIDSLKLIGNRPAWEAIHQVHLGMAKRQEKVEAVLPLVGEEDGYRPVVTLLPVQKMAAESRQKVIDLLLVEIQENLRRAAAGEKLQARVAYDHVGRLRKKYEWHDTLAEVLLDSAVRLGRVFILADLSQDFYGYDETKMVQDLEDEPLSGKKIWQVIHREPQAGVNYDFTLQAKVMDVDVSGNDKYVSCRTVEKQVQVGQNEIKDTSGNVTYEPIFETVTATIYDVRLEKRATARVEFEAWDPSGRRILDTWESVCEVFSENHSYYNGDARALDACLPSSYFENFPTDFWMLDNCADKLRYGMERQLWRLDVEE